jgi:hypothetical protein
MVVWHYQFSYLKYYRRRRWIFLVGFWLVAIGIKLGARVRQTELKAFMGQKRPHPMVMDAACGGSFAAADE